MTTKNKKDRDPSEDAKFGKKLDDKEEQRKLLEEEQEDLRAALKHPASRRFLARFYLWCGVERRIFSTNAMVMSNQEGIRDAGIQLKEEITGCSLDLLEQFEREVANVRRKPSK